MVYVAMIDTDNIRWRQRFRTLSQDFLVPSYDYVYRGIITPVTNKHLFVKSSSGERFFGLLWVKEVTIGSCLASDRKGESIIAQGAHFDVANGTF